MSNAVVPIHADSVAVHDLGLSKVPGSVLKTDMNLAIVGNRASYWLRRFGPTHSGDVTEAYRERILSIAPARTTADAIDCELALTLSQLRPCPTSLKYSTGSKSGDPSAAEQLSRLVYDELRKLARCVWPRKTGQSAIYFVDNGELHVSYCDGRRSLVKVASFKERLFQP